jgi:ribosomal-protein-alanine N-acetyltransferase
MFWQLHPRRSHSSPPLTAKSQVVAPTRAIRKRYNLGVALVAHPPIDHEPVEHDYSDWRFHAMCERDLDEIMVIEDYSFPTPWKRHMYEHDLRHNNLSRFYVIRNVRTGELAAYSGSWFIYDEAHVGSIATKAAFRGMRFAEQLISYTALAAVQEGLVYMVLEVREHNASAIRLYQRIGFVQVGRRRGYYSDTGEDALLMTNSDLQVLSERLRINEG